MVMYQWLLEFYMTYFDATNPLPDYIDKALHFVAFGMLILVFLFPIIMLFLVGKLIGSITGRGFND